MVVSIQVEKARQPPNQPATRLALPEMSCPTPATVLQPASAARTAIITRDLFMLCLLVSYS